MTFTSQNHVTMKGFLKHLNQHSYSPCDITNVLTFDDETKQYVMECHTFKNGRGYYDELDSDPNQHYEYGLLYTIRDKTSGTEERYYPVCNISPREWLHKANNSPHPTFGVMQWAMSLRLIRAFIQKPQTLSACVEWVNATNIPWPAPGTWDPSKEASAPFLPDHAFLP